MGRQRPEKKREKKNEGGQPSLPGLRESAPSRTQTTRILPMELHVGDRFTDETDEWEIIGRPYTTHAGKDARVRVRRVGQPDVTEIRIWRAHEHVGVKRASAEEGKR
jgi:hypothetical protein